MNDAQWEESEQDSEPTNSDAIEPSLLAHVMAQQSRAEAVQDRLLTEQSRLISRLSWFLLTTSILGQGNLIASDLTQKIDQMQEAIVKIERMRQ
jgi:hypothetical protein